MFKLKLSILLFVAVLEASGHIVNRYNNGFSLRRNFGFTGRELADPQPPPIEQAAKMARYIVHYSDWGSLSHISYQISTSGYPVGRDYSISDGPNGKSSGTPYLYLPSIDDGAQDLLHDPRCSLTMSLAQGDYCKKKKMDPEDPKCPQVILTGKCEFLQNNTDEWKFAQESLLDRHPIMKKWPIGHGWMIIKPSIEAILLVDDIGGNKYPTPDEYFAANPLRTNEEDPNYNRHRPIVEINLVL